MLKKIIVRLPTDMTTIFKQIAFIRAKDRIKNTFKKIFVTGSPNQVEYIQHEVALSVKVLNIVHSISHQRILQGA